ncbi:MAG: acyltransferase [Acidobacteria bacterium]|nr:acyltransferase [Acidobacteriota bacterium]
MSSPATDERYAYIDLVRVVAIILVHVFHTGMFFNTWEWHVKNPDLLPVLEPFMTVLHFVRMPLLMLVAGAGTAFALRRRSLGQYAGERTRRLLLPLLVGMILVVPPQVYAERVFSGAFEGSYLDWFPTVLQFRAYPKGNLSWHHLWFVAYLYADVLLTLPLVAWLGTPRGGRFMEGLSAWLRKGGRLYLLALPLGLGRLALLRFPETHDLIHDPKVVVFFLQLFLFGHLFGRRPELVERMAELRRPSLLLAALFLPAVFVEIPGLAWMRVLLVWFFAWSAMIGALGFARQHLRSGKPWLAYAQEIAYPFYILHQTVIVVLAWKSLVLPMGPWLRLPLLFAVSFAVTLLGCEVIRRVPWLRPLFGMKYIAPPGPDKRTVSVQTA